MTGWVKRVIDIEPNFVSVDPTLCGHWELLSWRVLDERAAMQIIQSIRACSSQSKRILFSRPQRASTTLPSLTRTRWNSTKSASSNEPPPLMIPHTGSVNLTPLRRLLALHGPDAAKFIQGLITKTFPSEAEPNGMFTSFLSPQVATSTSVPVDLLGASAL